VARHRGGRDGWSGALPDHRWQLCVRAIAETMEAMTMALTGEVGTNLSSSFGRTA